MRRRVLTGLAIGLTAVVLAPAASASVTPALSLDQSGGTQAASTVPLGMNFTFSPTGGDSPKDLTIGLPAGLLADASINGGACLQSSTPTPACQVGSGTVTATGLGVLPVTGQVAFDLVAPPKQGDLAGLALMVTLLGQTSQLGSPGEIAVRPVTDPAGFGLNISFANIPNTYDSLPIQVRSMSSTLSGVRMPASCPATPANVTVTTDSYSDPTPHTASAPLQVTGCSALPFTPAFQVTATKDAADAGTQVISDITQAASPAQATPQSVSLTLPAAVLSPNAHAVLSGGILCANPASGTCKTIGTATATSPLYPVPLTGTDYLTGTLSALKIVIVFPPPFALTLAGAVDVAHNTTTFTGLPDIPLSDLKVTLAGGPDAAFAAFCSPPSGTASSTLISQSGQRAAVSAPFTVAGCSASQGSGSGSGSGSKPSPTGRAGIVSGAISGLASGHPAISFKLTAGKNAKLKSFTVKLPRGLSFVRHRVHGRLKLLGVALKGAKVKSLSLKHGALLVTLRAPVNTLSAKIRSRALKESKALKSAAKHHRLKHLQLTVVLTNTAGKRITSRLPLKTG
ncbi:MAG TPA: hypothetical protein VFI54_10410 [Solirubrobacteraceae bacterium]|nr:hypothetical protein [Solirubrobacteraceae bacterium]